MRLRIILSLLLFFAVELNNVWGHPFQDAVEHLRAGRKNTALRLLEAAVKLPTGSLPSRESKRTAAAVLRARLLLMLGRSPVQSFCVVQSRSTPCFDLSSTTHTPRTTLGISTRQ